jgi:hypothetical protein
MMNGKYTSSEVMIGVAFLGAGASVVVSSYTAVEGVTALTVSANKRLPSTAYQLKSLLCFHGSPPALL